METAIAKAQPSAIFDASTSEEILQEYLSGVYFRSVKTRDAYRANVRRFFSWVTETGRNLGTLQEKDIVAYVGFLAPKATLTKCAYITAIRNFYAWTERRGLYRNIASEISIKKEAEDGPRKQHLTGDKSAELVEYFRESGNKRDFAIVLLMLHSGLRTVEVSRLRVCDVKISGGLPCVMVWGKGRSRDRLEATPTSWEAYAAVMDYLDGAARRPDDFLFQNADHAGEAKLSRRIERVSGETGRDEAEVLEMEEYAITPKSISRICRKGLDAIGLTNKACGGVFTAHSLRHTAAVDLLQKSSAGLYGVQGILRHQKSTTTEIYLASIDREAKLKRLAGFMMEAHPGQIAMNN